MREKLINCRDNKNMTQEQVAKQVGISRSFYGLIENGTRNPTYGIAKKIAEIFETPVDTIFFDIEGFRMKQKKRRPIHKTNTG